MYYVLGRDLSSRGYSSELSRQNFLPSCSLGSSWGRLNKQLCKIHNIWNGNNYKREDGRAGGVDRKGQTWSIWAKSWRGWGSEPSGYLWKEHSRQRKELVQTSILDLFNSKEVKMKKGEGGDVVRRQGVVWIMGGSGKFLIFFFEWCGKWCEKVYWEVGVTESGGDTRKNDMDSTDRSHESCQSLYIFESRAKRICWLTEHREGDNEVKKESKVFVYFCLSNWKGGNVVHKERQAAKEAGLGRGAGSTSIRSSGLDRLRSRCLLDPYGDSRKAAGHESL